MSRIRLFLYHWRKGRGFGYPRCCVLRFSAHVAFFGLGFQAVERGITQGGDHFWVPCCLFHRPDYTWDEWKGIVAARFDNIWNRIDRSNVTTSGFVPRIVGGYRAPTGSIVTSDYDRRRKRQIEDLRRRGNDL